MICPDHNIKLDRRPTRYGPLFVCPENECTVKCWGGSTSTPADDATRQLRNQLHRLFDPLWKDAEGAFCKGKRKNRPGVRRHRAYLWLSKQMGTEMGKTHFGMFDHDQCAKAIEAVRQLKASLQQHA